MNEKERTKTAGAFLLLVAELLICTGVGGVYGWATGMIIFGVTLLGHTVYGFLKIRKMP